jgi:hypothetical protein
MTRRRDFQVLEKTEQANTVQLFATIGADVYQLGTRRPRGRPCPCCGTFVSEFQGTCQTPGISDLVVFLPGHAGGDGPRPVLFLEQKASGGRFSPAQTHFRDVVQRSTAEYAAGTVDDVIAWLEQRGYLRRGGGWQSRSDWETKG